jgi:hypothetical protein
MELHLGFASEWCHGAQEGGSAQASMYLPFEVPHWKDLLSGGGQEAYLKCVKRCNSLFSLPR